MFILRNGVSEAEFLLTIHAFYQHLIDAGFARAYRVLRQIRFEGLQVKTLPPFTYRGELHQQFGYKRREPLVRCSRAERYSIATFCPTT